jgi:hypothetical protein
MATSRFVEIMGKEISKIIINSVIKKHNRLVKILKQLFAPGSMHDYRGIFTSTSSR